MAWCYGSLRMADGAERRKTMTIMFDTCALIALTNPDDPFHDAAERCYRSLKKGSHTLLISVISAAEFGVKGDISTIVPRLFRVMSYSLPHAVKAAQFARVTGSKELRQEPHDRQFIYADTQILAQAEVEQADYILTRDTRTFTRTATVLQKAGLLSATVVNLDDSALNHIGEI